MLYQYLYTDRWKVYSSIQGKQMRFLCHTYAYPYAMGSEIIANGETVLPF